jgi:tyrosyl-tRNA synthetase
MQKNFVKELRWRGMLSDIMPKTEKYLLQNSSAGYIGFDPTSDSLHIGSLVQIMILIHFQNAGHQPIALVGGATGMIGDPSGKSDERNLLDPESLQKNIDGIRNQLNKFLDFDSNKSRGARLVNNYDWIKGYTFIDFSRDVGKHLTVNYMMAKDSVKKRLVSEAKVGMSFTEFSYQLLQGYDFLHLYKNMDCKIQMGGSDQWGNITTGTELIRRKVGGKAYAITCPLITKSDGSKFGKTEDGNIWLDKSKTSPYKFYQYWLNSSDEDAESYIKIFTQLDQERISNLILEHRAMPQSRLLQKTIAEEVTRLVHSDNDLEKAQKASQILFGKSTDEDLKYLDQQTFLEVFEGVPQSEISQADFQNGIDIINLLANKTNFLKSNGEARRALSENSISVNKTKVNEKYVVGGQDLIDEQYILLQRGKKNYFIVKVVA